MTPDTVEKCKIATLTLIRHKTEVSLRRCHYKLVYKLYITLSGGFKSTKAKFGYKKINTSP